MPGQAGPHVAIMMAAVRGLVCVGLELVITLLLSAVASSVMGSVWRWPTVQGKFFNHKTSANIAFGFIGGLSIGSTCLLMDIES